MRTLDYDPDSSALKPHDSAVGMALFALALLDYLWRVYRQQPIWPRSVHPPSRLVEDQPRQLVWSFLAGRGKTSKDTFGLQLEKSPSDLADQSNAMGVRWAGNEGLTHKTKLVTIGLVICTALVFARSGYRSVEVRFLSSRM